MDPLLSSLMRQAAYKSEMPQLELKSLWTFLAIKRCQQFLSLHEARKKSGRRYATIAVKIFILIPLWRGFYCSKDILSDVHTVDVAYRRTKPWWVIHMVIFILNTSVVLKPQYGEPICFFCISNYEYQKIGLIKNGTWCYVFTFTMWVASQIVLPTPTPPWRPLTIIAASQCRNDGRWSWLVVAFLVQARWHQGGCGTTAVVMVEKCVCRSFC